MFAVIVHDTRTRFWPHENLPTHSPWEEAAQIKYRQELNIHQFACARAGTVNYLRMQLQGYVEAGNRLASQEVGLMLSNIEHGL